MAWTAPMTATLNQTFTAAQWNTHVRDNFNMTEAGKATTRGRLFVTTGANTVAEAQTYRGDNAASQSTTSTSYTSLAGAGPAVGTSVVGTTALVFWTVAMGNETATLSNFVSVAVSGASTVSASDEWAISTDGVNAAATSTDNLTRMAGFYRFTGLTPGWNIFTMQYKVSGGRGWFSNRNIIAMAL